MYDYRDVRKTLETLRKHDADAADHVALQHGLRSDSYTWDMWGPLMRPGEIASVLFDLCRQLSQKPADPRIYYGPVSADEPTRGRHQEQQGTWDLKRQME